jgi:predicted alpha/beta superfamily hydrolase
VSFASGSRATWPFRSLNEHGWRIFTILALALAAIQAFPAQAQQSTLPENGGPLRETFHSAILGEDRPLEIYLPAGYDPKSTSGYDVIYVLDGEMVARFFPPVRAFAEENELMPPTIIVGIDNIYWYDRGQDSRERDLLPAHVAGSPLSGGADKFLDFLSTELIPHINATYRTSGRNILFGHSYAGMFALYTFLTRPQSFKAYIASDPALWWNDGSVLALAERRIGGLPVSGKSLFIGGRSGRIGEAFGIKRMAELLDAGAPSGLRWRTEAQDDEDHGSVRLKNIYDGLKFSYFGRSSSMADFFPRDGILARGKPVTIMTYSSFLGQEPGVRYTLDGSEPKPTSPRFDYGVKVAHQAELTVKQFSNWGPDKVIKGRFVAGEPFASQPLPRTSSSGGLNFRCLANAAPSGAPIRGETAGRADGAFDVGSQAPSAPFACELNGYINATAAGYYIFFLEADTRASLSMDGRTLMSVNVPGDGQAERSFILPLMKGAHRIRIEYEHATGEKHFAFKYLPPAREQILAHLPVSVPAELLYGG